MKLLDMLVELANEFIALVVRDGENNDNGVGPADAAIQLLGPAQAVLVDLQRRRESKVDRQCSSERRLTHTLNSKEPFIALMAGSGP